MAAIQPTQDYFAYSDTWRYISSDSRGVVFSECFECELCENGKGCEKAFRALTRHTNAHGLPCTLYDESGELIEQTFQLAYLKNEQDYDTCAACGNPIVFYGSQRDDVATARARSYGRCKASVSSPEKRFPASVSSPEKRFPASVSSPKTCCKEPSCKHEKRPPASVSSPEKRCKAPVKSRPAPLYTITIGSDKFSGVTYEIYPEGKVLVEGVWLSCKDTQLPEEIVRLIVFSTRDQ